MSDSLSLRDRLQTLSLVATYRPTLAVAIVVLSVAAALLEGIGLSFLVPIVEQAQSSGEPTSGIAGVFATVYGTLGIPFTLEYIIAGVAAVMVTRFTASFAVAWAKAELQTSYVRELQTRSFEAALRANVAYFDQEGSDDILNAIITQTRYGARVIEWLVRLVEQGLLSLVYVGIAFYLAPLLTLGAAVILGGATYVVRNRFESGYTVGDRVAEANEQIQQSVQAGTQGIRDIKLFGLVEEVFADFDDAIADFESAKIKLRRNQAAMDNFHQMLTAITVFVLIYAALELTNLSLSSLGVFLFAMFRLSPRVSTLNNIFYKLEGDQPHLIRTHEFIQTLDDRSEPSGGRRPEFDTVEAISFEDVHFAYEPDEPVLSGVNFTAKQGEFIAFVGPSGAGKSTVVSLLSRMYDADSGEIRANGESIREFDVDSWREHVAVVRQSPFIFNDTLRYNVTVGNRDVSDREVERACSIAEVDEFLAELPDGHETVLGDDGVRLSGGQRQRIAIARAILKDAEVLVLDEATSDLDTDLEERVQQNIEGMDSSYTVLAIAHRLSTVTGADRIYTLEDGEIVETGDHTELMAADGTYADLYEMQSSL